MEVKGGLAVCMGKDNGKLVTCRGYDSVGPAVVPQGLKLAGDVVNEGGLPATPVQQRLYLQPTASRLTPGWCTVLSAARTGKTRRAAGHTACTAFLNARPGIFVAWTDGPSRDTFWQIETSTWKELQPHMLACLIVGRCMQLVWQGSIAGCVRRTIASRLV